MLHICRWQTVRFLSSDLWGKKRLRPSAHTNALYFAVAVKEALLAVFEGVRIRFHTDGGLFNLARLKVRTKISYVSITEIIFADNLCFLTESPDGLQELMLLVRRKD